MLNDGKKDDGGPAFPAIATIPMDDVYHQEGMTLRDWLASQALSGVGSWCPVGENGKYDLRTAETQKLRAEWAYAQADAMLAEREK